MMEGWSASGSRRVTTGLDSRGKAVVVRDELLRDDPRARVLWGADGPAVLRTDGAAPLHSGWWPPPGGVRVSLCQRLPERDVERPATTQAWPDIHDADGFHASASIDIVVMMAGEVVLELDDGIRVTLGAGDTLVQNGSRHRWRNETDAPALMAVIVIGTPPLGQGRPDA